jgi:flavin-dependent dehydrogenase
MRVLDRLGLLQRALAAGAVDFPGMLLISPAGHRIALDFSQDSSRSALGISRWRLDELAVARCRELGVEVIEGAHVREVLVEAASVHGVRASRLGKQLDVLGQVVVGADGHHSVISRRLGLDRPLRWPRRIGLAAHLTGLPLPTGLGEMHVGPAGYCGLAPQEDGRVNAAMVVDQTRFEARGCSVKQFFDNELRTYPKLRERAVRAERVTPVRGVGPLARRVRGVSGAGYLLVGDAAGFFDPFTGEGIVDALRGGELAADAIAVALEAGDPSATSLARYDRARAEAFARKRRAAWLVQGFVRAPRLMDYAIERIGARAEARSTLTGVFGDYRDAGIVLSPRFLWSTLRP